MNGYYQFASSDPEPDQPPDERAPDVPPWEIFIPERVPDVFVEQPAGDGPPDARETEEPIPLDKPGDGQNDERPPSATNVPAGFYAPAVVQPTIDTTPEPPHAPNYPALAMTLAEFAASRPDLANNWANATNPAYANDPNVPGILAHGTFENYLRDSAAAIGIGLFGGGLPVATVEVPPRTYPAQPPITTNSAAAAAYAASRPDLGNNWANAWNPAFFDQEIAEAIRSFGSFQAYLENDHGPFLTSSTGGGATSGGGSTGGGATASTMPPLIISNATALAHAAARPDLENNWRNAWAPGEHSTLGAQIRAYGTFQNYVLADYASQSSAGPATGGGSTGGGATSGSTMPPLIVHNAQALAHVQARPDLENNWRNAWAPGADSAIAIWIRTFPNFEAYVLDDIARRATTGGTTPTVPAPAAKTNWTPIMVALALAGGVYIWQNRKR